jgi:chromosome segregation ATPase
MITGFLPSLGSLALGQLPGAGAGAILLIVAAVLALVAGIALSRWRSLQQQLSSYKAEQARVQADLENAQGREQALAKKLEERQEEIRELKQEVASLRKKNYAAQEEAKSLRAELRSQAEERDRLLTSRPAFEAVAARSEAKPAPSRAEGPTPGRAEGPATSGAEGPRPKPAAKAEALAARGAPGDMSSEATLQSAQSEARAAAAAAREAAERLTKLESEGAALTAALAAERESVKALRLELGRLRRYSEQLRRIDVVSRGQVELLEDKLAALGRQYYEAVSELAALKGQVVPPRARAQRRLLSTPAKTDRGSREPAADSDVHATPESDALAAQMDAADAEARVADEEIGPDGADEGAPA